MLVELPMCVVWHVLPPGKPCDGDAAGGHQPRTYGDGYFSESA